MKNYLNVNNLRFASMVGIVAIHCGVFTSQGAGIGELWRDPVELITVQFWKYATLCFFMISGYLLGDKLEEYDPVTFFNRRVRAIGGPWVFWTLVTFLLLVSFNIMGHKSLDVFNLLYQTLFYSESWFVPNFLLALGILIFFRHWLDKTWFGIVLLILSLGYSTNQYLRILPTQHTTALFGFVFWLWLGYQFRRNQLPLIQKMNHLSMSVLVLGTIAGYSLGCLESLYINTAISPNGENSFDTLRFSNMLYGLFVYLLISKFSKPLYPKWINPRTETFGIYLSHWSITMVFGAVLPRILGHLLGMSHTILIHDGGYLKFIHIPTRILLWLITFIIVYGSALVITKSLGRTKFYRLAGMNAQTK